MNTQSKPPTRNRCPLATREHHQDAQGHSPTQTASRTGRFGQQGALHGQGQLRDTAIIAKNQKVIPRTNGFCHPRRCFCGLVVIGFASFSGIKPFDPRKGSMGALWPRHGPRCTTADAVGVQHDGSAKLAPSCGEPCGMSTTDPVRFCLCNPVVIPWCAAAVSPVKEHFAATVGARRAAAPVTGD